MKTKMMKPLSLVRVTLATIFLTTASCTGYNLEELPTTSNAATLDAMMAPTNFKWTTTQLVTVKITGSKSLAPTSSTLTISGAKGAIYKGLHTSSDNQEIKLTLPSNAKTITVKFKSNEQELTIADGKASLSFDNLATSFLPTSATSQQLRSAKEIVADQDGDNVADADDDYPTDQYKAYNNAYPSVGARGTLAFEDNWPAKADYDFNDVVIDYNINTVTNAQNQVVEVIGGFTLRASGATYNNGFGFQLDNITPNKITSVTGGNYAEGSYISLASNGLESGQTFANCIVFDEFLRIMPATNGSNGVNTVKGFSSPTKTVTVKMTFLKDGVAPAGGALLLSQLPASAYNFYIIPNRNREIEVHLPDRVPTSLANRSFLGTQDDDSAGAGRFYRTENNLPWAINIPQGFDYPVERAPLNEAYIHLIKWAETSGAEYPNWYESTAGYKDLTKIY